MSDTDKAAVIDDAPRDMSPEEVAIALSGQAVYVNKTMVIGMSDNMVRLSFVEQVPNALPVFRTAVVMGANEFMKLKAVIDRVSGNFKLVDLKSVLPDAEQ